MTYGDGNLGEVLEGLFQIVGQALGGGAHGVDVHAVCAGAHNAAQTAGAEFKVLVEGFDKRGGVFGVEHLFYFGACGLVILVGKPYHGFFLY